MVRSRSRMGLRGPCPGYSVSALLTYGPHRFSWHRHKWYLWCLFCSLKVVNEEMILFNDCGLHLLRYPRILQLFRSFVARFSWIPASLEFRRLCSGGSQPDHPDPWSEVIPKLTYSSSMLKGCFVVFWSSFRYGMCSFDFAYHLSSLILLLGFQFYADDRNFRNLNLQCRSPWTSRSYGASSGADLDQKSCRSQNWWAANPWVYSPD